jgi:hypothetical protein
MIWYYFFWGYKQIIWSLLQCLKSCRLSKKCSRFSTFLQNIVESIQSSTKSKIIHSHFQSAVADWEKKIIILLSQNMNYWLIGDEKLSGISSSQLQFTNSSLFLSSNLLLNEQLLLFLLNYIPFNTLKRIILPHSSSITNQVIEKVKWNHFYNPE